MLSEVIAAQKYFKQITVVPGVYAVPYNGLFMKVVIDYHCNMSDFSLFNDKYFTVKSN